jgi:anti-anti-sigma factor
MNAKMNIYEEHRGQTIRLFIEGHLDAITAPRLQERLDKLGDDTSTLIFDFSRLTYISSAGVRVLLVALKKVNANKGRLLIQNVPPDIREVFETSGLIGLFVHDEKFVIIEQDKTETSIRLSIAGDFNDEALMTLREKLNRLESAGCYTVITLDFHENSSISPEGYAFLKNETARLRARHIALVVINAAFPFPSKTALNTDTGASA